MKVSAEYRGIARGNLKNNWGTAILVSLIVVAVSSLLSMIPAVGWIISLLFAGQFMVGELIYFTRLNRRQEATFTSMFDGFGKNWLSNFLTYLLQQVYIILWTLLFIIPGIIKMYSYSMTMYIKSQNPEMGHNEAITLSRKLMDGKKEGLFHLHLTFLGWALLAVLTFGIGFIFLLPYMQASNVAFYEDVYNEYNAKNNPVIESAEEEIEIQAEEE